MGAVDSPRKRSRHDSQEPPAKRSADRHTRERSRSRSKERHQEHRQEQRDRHRDREGYRARERDREGRDRDSNPLVQGDGGSRHERGSRHYDDRERSREHRGDHKGGRDRLADDRDNGRRQQQQQEEEPERHQHQHQHHHKQQQPEGRGPDEGPGRAAAAGRRGGGARGGKGGARGRDDGDQGEGKQRWGKPEEWAEEEAAAAPPAVPKEAPNLGLSGKLAAETNKAADGKTEMKYQPPPEARVCKQPPWKLFVFKGDTEAAPAIRLTQHPFYLFGKDRQVADIPTDHPSCSRQHAVIVFREVEMDAADGIAMVRLVKPYLIDLESVNGTFINGERVEGARYYELLHSDVIKFGLSTREYVIMDEAAAP